MNKIKLSLEIIQWLLEISKDIGSIAVDLEGLCNAVSDSLQAVSEDTPELPKTDKPKISLEQVRGLLAEKSRDGKTSEVKGLLKKFGAEKLSDIDPDDYESVMNEAEGL